MAKRPVSVTLEDANLLWLRAHVTRGTRRNLSDALDAVVTAARQRPAGVDESRSVRGSIDLPSSDPDLTDADAYIRALFQGDGRPAVIARKTAVRYATKRCRTPGKG
jgi:Arc/MetJ-type ribon-helix-helix transcriptional regulator